MLIQFISGNDCDVNCVKINTKVKLFVYLEDLNLFIII